MLPLPFLSPVFGDNMVLQRDQVNVFWGWTEPGKKVDISFGGSFASAIAGADGKWTVKIKPPKAGGPYEVKIIGPTQKTLKNVLVGDVWICSGQSNMEMGITLANNPEQEIKRADEFPKIRFCMMLRSTPLSPLRTAETPWKVCSSKTIVEGGWGGSSAVATFFGMDLYDLVGVPIGLIQTSWGGTVGEAWVSKSGLSKVTDFAKVLQQIDQFSAPNQPNVGKRFESWFKTVDPISASETYSSAPANSQMQDVPFSLSKRPDLGFGHVYWVRREFNIEALPEETALLTTGSNQDVLSVWINGKQVVETYAGQTYGQIQLSKGILKSGQNVITMRLLAYNEAGGFLLNGDHLNLRFGDSVLPLGGKFGTLGDFPLKVSLDKVPPVLEGNPNTPTVLFNGMIAPLAPMAVKGAIWYQGESNIGRAEQYKSVLAALIEDWRKAFNHPKMPFMVVQLQNFGSRSKEPNPNSAWAALRDAQASVAATVPNVSLATAVDIGEANDIHPKNKQMVGRRLAFQSVKFNGQEDLGIENPRLIGVTFKGNSAELAFSTNEDLVLHSEDKSFALSADGKSYHWAVAKVSKNKVTVTCPVVSKPRFVMYGWDDDPAITLFTKSGQPVIPFKTGP